MSALDRYDFSFPNSRAQQRLENIKTDYPDLPVMILTDFVSAMSSVGEIDHNKEKGQSLQESTFACAVKK